MNGFSQRLSQHQQLLAQLMQEEGIPCADAARIPRRNCHTAPLSFGQERLWFLYQLEPDQSLYNVPIRIRMQGRLDTAVLERSLIEIVRRHEIMRTTISEEQGIPVQLVHPAAALPIRTVHLQEIPQQRHTKVLENILDEHAHIPLDLATPGLRVLLVQIAPEVHVLQLLMHHIVIDGWSVRLLMQEFTKVYAAFHEGEESPLPKLEIQYADYAIWQREWVEESVLNSQMDYWRGQLAALPPAIHLPVRTALPAQTNKREEFKFHLSAELSLKLREIAKQEKTTLFMLLLAAFKVLLFRYTGQNDIVIGSPVAGRNHPQTQALLGFFVNTLLLRSKPVAHQSFHEFLSDVRNMVCMALDHQDVPFEKVVKEIQPDRELNSPLVFRVLFALQEDLTSRWETTALQLQQEEVRLESAKFDLSLQCCNQETEITGKFTCRASLFEDQLIYRMSRHFQTLLGAISEIPGQPIAELPMLDPRERNRILAEWNQTGIPYERDKCIHEIFSRQARCLPDAVAVVLDTEHITYEALEHKAECLYKTLKKAGVQTETVVAVCAERSLEVIIALLAVLKAGGIYVPLELEYPEEMLAYILQDSKADLVLTTKASFTKISQHQGRVIFIESELDGGTIQDSDSRPPEIVPENLAYVMYTSGSSGRPKGTGISHQSVIKLVRPAAYANLTQETVILQFAPLAFDASTFEIWGSLLNGGRLVMMPPGLPTLDALATTIRNHKINLLWLTAGLFHQMIEEQMECLGLVDHVVTGGDVVAVKDVQRYLVSAQKSNLSNGYGPTECTTFTTVHQMSAHSNFPEGESVPIGRPIGNTTTYVLGVGMQPVPVGVPGELHIGGDGVARGYWNRASLTAEKFVPDPFTEAAGARLYRTGDLARWKEDGILEFLSRIDQQVKIRGYRVEPEEVEEALRAEPDVRAAAVAVHEYRAGEKCLIGYVVLHENSTASGEELQARLRKSLPQYMVPASIVLMPDLPLTLHGKLDRKALALIKESPNPTPESYVAPRTTVEELLAAVWEDVLGVSPISIDSDFFAIGGHSLLAMRVLSKMQAATGAELSLRTLFEHPTIAELAEEVEKNRKSTVFRLPAVVPVPDHQMLPLSFGQQRLWFTEKLGFGGTAYNMIAGFDLAGPLNISALELALLEIDRRHEVLRTSFSEIDGQAVQQIHAPAKVILRKEAMSLSEDFDARLSQLLIEENSIPFDLARGPLWRARLIQLDSERHALFIKLHHIAGDAWSLEILMREIEVLYEDFLSGRPASLPELPVQYGDYAVWQRKFLQDEMVGESLDYWRDKLGGVETLSLPTDFRRPAVIGSQGARYKLILSRQLSSELKALSRHENVTLFMTMLAAFKLLLSRLAGQDDVAVGLPIANRSRPEVQDLIGFFLNTLVLRTRMARTLMFVDVLKDLRKTCVEAYQHQSVPFERLVEELQPERTLRHNPLFQVMFNMLESMGAAPDLPGIKVEPIGLDITQSKFDLTLHVCNGEALSLYLVYNTSLFKLQRIREFCEQYVALLTQVVKDPNRRIDQYSLLTDEARLLLPDPSLPLIKKKHKPFSARFTANVRSKPDSVAVAYPGGALSYGELDKISTQIAHSLLQCGEKNQVVAIYAERNYSLVSCFIGAWKAKAICTVFDSSYPAARLSHYLTIAKPAILIDATEVTQLPAEVRAVLNSYGGKYLSARPDTRPDKDEPQEDIATFSWESFEDDDAYLAFTSGSTGEPKAVEGAHGPLPHFLDWYVRTFNVSESDRYSLFSGLSHDPLRRDIMAPLSTGATLCVPPENIFRTIGLKDWIQDNNVTVMHLTPAHGRILEDSCNNTALSSLRYLMFVGDVLSEQQVESSQRWAPAAQCINFYGTTETPQVMSYHPVQSSPENNSAIPLGRGIDDVQLLVLTTAGLAGIGEPGEICVRTPYLTKGYLNDPELTQQRYVLNPFSNSQTDRMYKTGDQGRYLPSGLVEYAGRLDQQVKVRGYRIELQEIEAVLRKYKDVRQAAVAAISGPANQTLLVAYVVPAAEAVDIEGLQAFARQSLPTAMVPLAFIQIESIPLTPNGKIDYRALPPAEIIKAKTYVAPGNIHEERLCRIWGAVLGLDRVGIHDNFFALGGDSILSIQLIARARVEGLILEPSQIFQHQTVAQLAGELERAEKDRNSGSGEIPLTIFQKQLVAQTYLHGSDGENIASLLLELQDGAQSDVLREAILAVFQHHRILGIRYENGTIRPLERTGDLWQQVDLSGLPEHQATALKQSISQIRRALSNSDDRLGAVVEYELGSQHRCLLIALHPLIADVEAWRILLRDIENSYAGLAEKRSISFEGEITFYNWSQCLLSFNRRQRELEQMGHVPLPEPFGEISPESCSHKNEYETIRLWLNPEETCDLLQNAHAAYRTQIEDILLAALVTCYSKSGRTEPLAIDVERDCRDLDVPEYDLRNVVGCFMGQFPVLMPIIDAEDLHPGKVLVSIKERLRESSQHGSGLEQKSERPEYQDDLKAILTKIRFCHLGELDSILVESSIFRTEWHEMGAWTNAGWHALNVTTYLFAGRLNIAWSYDEALFKRETMEGMSGSYIESLHLIIEHCCTQDEGGYTASDFPLIKRGTKELAQIAAALAKQKAG